MAGVDVGGVRGGVPQPDFNGRRVRATGRALARLGDHDCDRYARLLAHGLAGDLVSRVAGDGVRAAADLSPEHHEALWGSQSFYRVFSTVNGGRVHETDLFEGIRDERGAGSAAPLGDGPCDVPRAGASAGGSGCRATRGDAAWSCHPRRIAIRCPQRARSERPAAGNGYRPGPLLEETAKLLFEHSLFNAHPRFFGYITASPAPIGILADFLAAAVNPNVGAWTLAPAATEIEAQTVRWIAELIGYPVHRRRAAVERRQHGKRRLLPGGACGASGLGRARRGDAGGAGRRLRVYASGETHTWLQKAADLSGLGTESIRWIPTDADLRMDVQALQRQLEADTAGGDVPFVVVGTAGSVSTGAVDPLRDIAAICKDSPRVVPRRRRVRRLCRRRAGRIGRPARTEPRGFRGRRSAQVALRPLEAGCALVRDPEQLRAAFAYHPPYYHFFEKTTNYVDYGPQNSRGFRALKVWLALRQVGAAGYRTMIADDIRLSRAMADAVKRHPELQLTSQELSITTFRYVPEDLRGRMGTAAVEQELDNLNRTLLDRLQREGEIFVSNAIIAGRYVLRACIVNFHTERADVEALPEIVVRRGRALWAEQRKGGTT